VTRELVLRLAKRKKVLVREVLMRPKDLLSADECFITNTTMEIMPVRAVDNKPVGNGRPGPVTALLHEAYKKEVLACLKTQESWRRS
jgi:branched-subunit amino acid aminotransferase/4-amino-4-deoxychorismate lyase